jgi:hypothetical protein
MGMMKRFLMDKIEEWQRLHPQWTLEEIYNNDNLYRMASEYAEMQLKAMGQKDGEKHG